MVKRVFRVFEAGSGDHPIGLLKKAVSARKRGMKRVFTGVDYETNLEATLIKSGLKKPINLKLVKGCALKELELKRPGT